MALTKQQKLIFSFLSLIIVGLLAYLLFFRDDEGDDTSNDCKPPKKKCANGSCMITCYEDVNIDKTDDACIKENEMPSCDEGSSQYIPYTKECVYGKVYDNKSMDPTTMYLSNNTGNVPCTVRDCNMDEKCKSLVCMKGTKSCQLSTQVISGESDLNDNIHTYVIVPTPRN